MGKIILHGSENLYSFLLQLYPKRYKQEFGEEMKYVFTESLKDAYSADGLHGVVSLWLRTIIDGIKSGPKEHVENIQNILFHKKGGGTMTIKNNDIFMQNKIFLYGALATASLMLIPLLGGWPWNLFDFIFAIMLLFGTGSAFILLARKVKNHSYRLGIGLGLLGAFLLIWVNGAVGIIGDPEDGTADLPNLMYIGVLAIGFFGAILSRFNPKGMARTLFSVAAAQMIVPIVMLSLNPHVLSNPPGVIGVFILNAFFAMCFSGSAILFKQASNEKR